MMRRAIPTFAVLIVFSQTATAGVPLFGHVSCAVVRFYVAKYSEATAEKWARSHGASAAEIESARHCLHSTDVQTASLAPRSQTVAPVTEREGAQPKPDERDLDQGALRVPVEGQRADAERNSHDDEPDVHGVPNDIENCPTVHVSYEVKEDDLVPSDGKTITLRQRNVGVMHRAYRAGATGHVAWLKRLWDHLTRPPRFRVAFLHLRGGRR